MPLVGLVELAAHAVQTHRSVPESDWAAAAQYVAREVHSDDLVAFAPAWVDPVGRQRFGSKLATIAREARPDESRFPRAFEVSVRGAHLAAFAGWHRSTESRFGALRVTTWENPAPARVIDDLVSLVDASRLRVTELRGSTEAPCPFVHGRTQTGGLGFGPAVPGDRFACPSGSFVGASIVADLDYRPHRCIYAPPVAGASLRLRFAGVRFGRSLHGHHALYVEAERGRTGAPVTLTFSTEGAVLGSIVHRDGEGWKPFELDTSDLVGKTGDLVVEIASSGERRMYCFEADTR